MVVISVALCSRGGKPVLARQFVEISRMRMEALLASFPKLVSPTKQHTYIESESVRYVFQPMESLYLLMVTTKNSNIVEDLDTLRLLSKVVYDACPLISEESIMDSAFELVAAFDEVISLGYREAIGLAGIRANLEMNSHEEKLSQMIRISKEEEAKQFMKRKSAEIRAKKVAEGKSGPGGGSMDAFGSGSKNYAPPSTSAYSQQAPQLTSPKMNATSDRDTAPKASNTDKEKRGIKIKQANKKSQFLEALAADEGMDAADLEDNIESVLANAAVPGAVSVPKDPVQVSIQENVSATMESSGTLKSYQVTGEVKVISRNEDAKFTVQLTKPSSLFTFNLHPQVDKNVWAKQSLVQMKKVLQSNTPFGAMKYRCTKADDTSDIPLSLTVWPEAAKGNTNVNMEFELHGEVDLQQVMIVVPLGSSESPEVKSCSVGTHRHNSRRQQLEWVIDEISQDNSTGSFEFDIPKTDPSNFFPTVVTFSATKSLAGLEVVAVTNPDDDSPVRFGSEVLVSADEYEVVADD